MCGNKDNERKRFRLERTKSLAFSVLATSSSRSSFKKRLTSTLKCLDFNSIEIYRKWATLWNRFELLDEIVFRN